MNIGHRCQALSEGNRRSPARPSGKAWEELTARFGERLNALGGVGRYAQAYDGIGRNGAAVKRDVRRETGLYQIAMRHSLHGVLVVCGKVCELV